MSAHVATFRLSFGIEAYMARDIGPSASPGDVDAQSFVPPWLSSVLGDVGNAPVSPPNSHAAADCLACCPRGIQGTGDGVEPRDPNCAPALGRCGTEAFSLPSVPAGGAEPLPPGVVVWLLHRASPTASALRQ